MYRPPNLRRARRSAGAVCAAGMSLALVALLAGCAAGPESSPPPSAQPPQQAVAEPAPAEQPCSLKTAEAAPPAEKPAAEATASGCGATPGPDPKPSPAGPQPRWVCKERSITAEPVWRGESINFVFTISNEGEADLNVKLKGG